MQKFSVILAVICLSTACTWVKVDEDGSKVAVTSIDRVAGCEKVQNVHVKVKSNLGPVDRNSEKVATELATLARNEASSFGGDTVVPTSTVDNGRQSFGVYKCKR